MTDYGAQTAVLICERASVTAGVRLPEESHTKEKSMNYNLVLHVDAGDTGRVAFALGNVRNYLKDVPANSGTKIVIVANGPAVRCFTKTPENAQNELTAQTLMKAGLSIRLCRNALKGFGVSEDMLWDDIETVSGGITELCRLQQEGNSYIKP